MKTPYRSPFIGSILKIISFLMILLGAVGVPLLATALGGFGWLAAILAMLSGIALYYFAARLDSLPADELPARDKRAPIVFVRSF